MIQDVPTCNEELKGLPGPWAPASAKRVSTLPYGGQGDKAEEESIQGTPARLHSTQQEGWQEEEEAEDEHREDGSVQHGGLWPGETPASLQQVEGPLGEDGQEQAGDHTEDKQGEGDSYGTVENEEELGLAGFGGVGVRACGRGERGFTN